MADKMICCRLGTGGGKGVCACAARGTLCDCLYHDMGGNVPLHAFIYHIWVRGGARIVACGRGEGRARNGRGNGRGGVHCMFVCMYVCIVYLENPCQQEGGYPCIRITA